MNQSLKIIFDFIQQSKQLSEEEKGVLTKATKDADKALTISDFKLERTEKVKRTTAILLEETIDELELKRKDVEETNQALKNSLEELKATQAQLIQAEKMASLGELTAGIAHEIQNPLNFVNNFSDVSKELLEEMLEELENGDVEEAKTLGKDVIQNLEKIFHHGQRADGIVKGMLQHSRSHKGEKESIDLNNLVDEYLRLAYHGLRAKDKTFNSTIETAYDDSIDKLAIVPQDIGRAILNLINNAFYTVNEKKKRLSATAHNDFQPSIHVSTQKVKSKVIISVKDNGDGIPKTTLSKIFQPFYTTKPTGQGTGLGLSLSYDIVKAHEGELEVATEEGLGSEFKLFLPIKE